MDGIIELLTPPYLPVRGLDSRSGGRNMLPFFPLLPLKICLSFETLMTSTLPPVQICPIPGLGQAAWRAGPLFLPDAPSVKA